MDVHTAYLGLAIAFGFLMAWGIGANDVSNAMGTSVGSGAISIRQAILIAAVFEFLGAFLAGGQVTQTISNDLLDISQFQGQEYLLVRGMLASLLASAVWLFVASHFGWPVSTTHTIIGAIVGFGSLSLGVQVVAWKKIFLILLSWICSPLLGGLLSFALFKSLQKFIFDSPYPSRQAKRFAPLYAAFAAWCIATMTLRQGLSHFGYHLTLKESMAWALLVALIVSLLAWYAIGKILLDPKNDAKFRFATVERIFKILMLFTACSMSFAHGSNDVANAIGPVSAVVSILSGNSDFYKETAIIPMWVLLLGGGGIVIGLATYGHKVMATIGTGITQLTPSRGFSSELATAATVIFASATGLPISTTHTLVGAILGVGLARGLDALNLHAIRNIFMSWIITLPVGAGLAILFFEILEFIFT